MIAAVAWFVAGFWAHWTLEVLYAIFSLCRDPAVIERVLRATGDEYTGAVKAASDGGR